MKAVIEILKENREVVISYYNENIKGNWNVTLSNFMKDVMDNFEKVTLGDEYRKFDVVANCGDAKSRLGMFDNKVEVLFDRDAYRKSKVPNQQWNAIV